VVYHELRLLLSDKILNSPMRCPHLHTSRQLHTNTLVGV